MQVEPGLGKSELFYSLVVGSLQFSSIIGGFLSAILIKWIPYWYQFIFFLCTHILGFVLYGTATQGWVLLPAMLLVGFYLGAEVTLGFNYATDMSVKYVELLKDSGETFDCDKTKAVKVRNFLYALHTVGYSTGFVIGTGKSIGLKFNKGADITSFFLQLWVLSFLIFLLSSINQLRGSTWLAALPWLSYSYFSFVMNQVGKVSVAVLASATNTNQISSLDFFKFSYPIFSVKNC